MISPFTDESHSLMDSKESLKFNNQLIYRDLVASEKKEKANLPGAKEPNSEKVVKQPA